MKAVSERNTGRDYETEYSLGREQRNRKVDCSNEFKLEILCKTVMLLQKGKWAAERKILGRSHVIECGILFYQ